MEEKCPFFKLKTLGYKRTVAYGYRWNEIPTLKVQTHISDDFKVLKYAPSAEEVRKPCMISLGPHINGACDPHVDAGHASTAMEGAKKRLGIKIPGMTRFHRRRFRRFVYTWCKLNLSPLDANTDFSLENWLQNTNYPEWRKNQLRRANASINDPHLKRYKLVKSFIKDETYPDYKHARTINSRSDEFKTLVGPYVKQAEKILFNTKWFIKYIPMDYRPSALLERLESKYKYINSTDFTSFEAHFVELLEDTEFIFYEHMFQNIPDREYILKLLKEGLLTHNVLAFKSFMIEIYRRRMSGEMSTSSGNGFANLMLILYIVNKIMKEKTDPFCEGDDGIFGTNTRCPSAQWLYNNLGIVLKLEICENVADASFCGNVFDPTDKLVVTDPIAAMTTFGWTTNKYISASLKRHKELLRSKSLSMLYQYRGNPILSELAQYGLRVTTGVRARTGEMNEYMREEMKMMLENMKEKGLPIVEVPLNTRMLVQSKFGILICDQMAIEDYLRNKNDLSPISCPQLSQYLTKPSQHYYHNYVAQIMTGYNVDAVMPVYISCV